MYVELIEGAITNRGNILPIGSIGTKRRDVETYISLFPFTKDILDYVKIHGSIKGYRGKHACTYICIDIDKDGDLEGARQSTLQVIEQLNSLYNIAPDELFIFFSGNKGFHVYLVDRLLGLQNRFFDNIGEGVKGFISKRLEGIPDVDLIIYEDHRIIRVVNSKHAKSGLYKIELSYDDLQKPIEEIKTLAVDIYRPIRKILYSDIQENERLHNDFITFLATDLKQVQEKRQDIFWGAMPEGKRNDGYFRQASALVTYSELSEKSILSIIQSLNDASNKPLPEYEIRNIVSSAYNNATAKKEDSKPDEMRVFTFRDCIPLWIDSIKPEKNKITLGFEAFDLEMKGKLRGTLGLVIGYGGSKKSLYSQYISYLNVLNEQRIIYSSMEMGLPAVMSRFIDMSVSMQGGGNAHYILQENHDANDYLNDVLSNYCATVYKDLLLTSDQSSMNYEKYKNLIQSVKKNIGLVDILIVDGLSMMGGAGTETENYSQNSKMLKELSKEENIFILLIAHVSKGGNRDDKDLARHIRASEKIIDNCDWYISASQVKAEDPDKDFEPSIGNFRLVNKRGSGNIIDQAFELNCDRLHFRPIDQTVIKTLLNVF
jgi:archaellum biogenesis ATPase FlaH